MSPLTFALSYLFIYSAKAQNHNAIVACTRDFDCKTLSATAKCVEHLCECENDCKHYEERIVTKIGEPCVTLQECNVPESYCFNTTCICKSGSVGAKNGKMCLKMASGIGSSCIEDVQCSAVVKSSVCKEDMCRCREKHHFTHDLCVASKELGEVCSIAAECTTEYSECETTCKCIKRYVESKNKCLLAAKSYLSSCLENVQCEYILGLGSVCEKALCKCKDLHHFDSSQKICVRDKFFGELCVDDEDCHQPGMECILSECQCTDPYIQHSNHCISDSSVEIYTSSIFYIFLPTFISLIFVL